MYISNYMYIIHFTVRFVHFFGGYLGPMNSDQLIVCCVGTVVLFVLKIDSESTEVKRLNGKIKYTGLTATIYT